MKAREIFYEPGADNKVLKDLNEELLRHKETINEIVKQTEVIKMMKRFQIVMNAEEIYEEDEIVGWIIRVDRTVFAIGKVPDDEILKIVGKNTAGDVNIIKCKGYELENWNMDYC